MVGVLKLLIKQGPFYITAFTALFIALDNQGWIDRMFPQGMEDVAAIISPAEDATEPPTMPPVAAAEEVPMPMPTLAADTKIPPFLQEKPRMPSFHPDEEPTPIPIPDEPREIWEEPWFSLLIFIGGGLVLGYAMVLIARRTWEWLLE